MAEAFQRNHTVSAGYLRRFTKNGVVTVHHLTRGTREDGPKAVGFQENLWGPEKLARTVEDAFGKGENAGLRAMRRLSEQWPLGTPDRAVLAEFLAIHIIRTPAFGVFARRSGLRAVRDVAQRHGLTPDQVAAATRRVMGPHMHANALLGQVGRIGGVFCSMSWALVQFDQDILITSDQPVILLPLAPSPITPASCIPPNGMSATVEVCFALDPRQALLMTWADEPDTEHPLRGTYGQACSINCALRAQSLKEWVCRPHSSPPFYAPPLLQPRVFPISAELMPGYLVEVATQSHRRAEAARLMYKTMEEDSPRDQMRWVRIDRREAA